MPPQTKFVLPEYYETLCHELVHWTEASHRLNWDRQKPENSYACGELIAELGGCFLASEMGLSTADNLINHAAYLKSWIAALKSDHKFIFKAASQASRAVDFILSFSRTRKDLTESLDELILA
jgi:antirestriction protein ArdC